MSEPRLLMDKSALSPAYKKPKVLKSPVTGMWVAKVYSSPYSMTPSYLEYSHHRDALATALSPRFQDVFAEIWSRVCSCVMSNGDTHEGCARDVKVYEDGFTRGMCSNCTSVRCDLPRED